MELEGEVALGDGGEGLVEEGEKYRLSGGPSVLACAAVLEVVD